MNKELLKEFLDQYNMVGCNICHVDKDMYVEDFSYKLASIENNRKSINTDIYRIASISKVIVAIGVLMLKDKGLVDLDEDISKYLGFKVQNPYYKDVKITIRMVMTQTASISDEGDYIDGVYKGYDGSNQTDDYIKLSELFDVNSVHYLNTYTNYMPGTHFEYSNLGCGILACVVEKVTGVYFPDYIVHELLEPMGIYSGFRLENLKYKDRLVSHYLYDDDNDKFILYRDYDRFKKVQCLKYPLGDNYRGVAGGLYISSLDLSKIMMMLMNDGVYGNFRYLKEETVKEMKTVQWEGIPSDPTYRKKGLQMIIMDQFTNDALMGHFGNAYGLRSFMLFNKNGGIIFLCNGANFLSDEEHMTKLQEALIKFLVKETNL